MMMTKEQAAEFASKWLPAWTGNDPEKLAAFYSETLQDPFDVPHQLVLRWVV